MKSHLLAFFNLESIDSPCLDATKLTNELILAPNPNSGIFYLYNNSAEINNTTISIYNNLGQIISIEKNITLKADGLKYLDLRNLPNNIYYLLITSKNYTKQFSITLI